MGHSGGPACSADRCRRRVVASSGRSETLRHLSVRICPMLPSFVAGYAVKGAVKNCDRSIFGQENNGFEARCAHDWRSVYREGARGRDPRLFATAFWQLIVCLGLRKKKEKRTSFLPSASCAHSKVTLDSRQLMGCGQVVRQQFLVLKIVGSNPTTPASTS